MQELEVLGDLKQWYKCKTLWAQSFKHRKCFPSFFSASPQSSEMIHRCNELLIRVFIGKVMSDLRAGLCGIRLIFGEHIIPKNIPKNVYFNWKLKVVFFFTSAFTLLSVVTGREQPDRPVRTLSRVRVTQRSQSSVDHRTSLTPSSDTSHLRLVSLTTPGLPQGISPQPAQHPGYVSVKHQETFFPTRLQLFFHTSWTLCCQQQRLGPWFSSSWGRALKLPTYPPATSKPPPPHLHILHLRLFSHLQGWHRQVFMREVEPFPNKGQKHFMDWAITMMPLSRALNPTIFQTSTAFEKVDGECGRLCFSDCPGSCELVETTLSEWQSWEGEIKTVPGQTAEISPEAWHSSSPISKCDLLLIHSQPFSPLCSLCIAI